MFECDRQEIDLPVCWFPLEENALQPFSLQDFKELNALVVLAISPFAFKQSYDSEYLNRCANYGDLLPRKGESYFEPESHSAINEIDCCEMMIFVKNLVCFALKDSIMASELMLFAEWMLGLVDDVEKYMNDATRLCVKLFGNDISKRKKFVALFAIVLHIVFDTKQNSTILKEFTYKLELHSEKSHSLKEQAKVLMKNKSYNEAVRFYKQAIKIKPFDHFIYSNLAQAYLETERFQCAEWCAQRAIWLNPTWPKSPYRWIQAVEKQGCFQKALQFSHTISKTIKTMGYFFTGSKEMLDVLVEQEMRLLNQVFFPETPNALIRNKRKGRRELPILLNDNNKLDCHKKFTVGDQDEHRENFKLKHKEFHEALLPKPKVPDDLPPLVLDGNANQNSISRSSLPEQNGDKTSGRPANVNRKVNETDCSRYYRYVKEGSSALIQHSYKVACDKYALALAVLKSKGRKKLKVLYTDEIVLKYCYGKSCIGKHTNADIECGLKIMDEIITEYYEIAFPLAYYGKALGYISQNNYKEASDVLLKLNTVLDNDINLAVHEYPCYEDKIIEESNPDKLKELAKELTSKCKNPPFPNALCRYSSTDCHRSEIYFNDPDFQGFVQLICQDNCNIQYHLACWKEAKKERKLYRDKELLEHKCFTPDCSSLISKIEIFGADGNLRKTVPKCHEEQKSVKSQPSLVHQTTVQVHNNNKEKKMFKPTRKRKPCLSENSVESDLSECKQNPSAVWTESLPDTRKDPEIVIQKRKQDIKPVEKKVPSRKDNALLHLDFNRSDDSRIQRLKLEKEMMEQGDDEKMHWDKKIWLTAVQQSLLASYSDGKADNIVSYSDEKVDDVVSYSDEKADNVVEFLEGLIQFCGPMSIDSPTFAQELSGLPYFMKRVIDDCGGIKRFLLKTQKFDVIDHIVLLPRHLDHVKGTSASLLTALDLAIRVNVTDVDKFNLLDRKTLSFCSLINRHHGSLESKDVMERPPDLQQYFEYEERLSCNKSRASSCCSMESSLLGEEETSSNRETLSVNVDDMNTYEREPEVESLEKTNQLLVDECQRLKDRLVQTQNEMHMMKEVHQIEKADLEERVQKVNQSLKCLQSNYDNLVKKSEVEKRKPLNDLKVSVERNEMLQREIEKLTTSESELTKLLDEMSNLLTAAEEKSKLLSTKLQESELDRKSLKKQNEVFMNEIKCLENKLFEMMKVNSTQKPGPYYGYPGVNPYSGPSLVQCRPPLLPLPTLMDQVPGYSGLGAPIFVPGTSHYAKTSSYNPQLSANFGKCQSTSDLSSSSSSGFVAASEDGKAKQKSLNTINPHIDDIVSSWTKVVANKPELSVSKSTHNIKRSNETAKQSDILSSKLPFNKLVPPKNSTEASSSNRQKFNATTNDSQLKTLIDVLHKEFPTCSYDVLMATLKQVSAKNNNTLTGLKMIDILKNTRSRILSARNVKGFGRITANSSDHLGLDTFDEVPVKWDVPPSSGSVALKRYRNDECNICLEPMGDAECYYLACGHAFHHMCVKEWFNTRSTCPNCGKYSTLEDEYPPLA